MFDGLMKSKFYCKCKSGIKQARTRIELIRKKRNAMEKYLRNDVADLLKGGLDINAYGRAEGLVVEMNLSSCYEFVDQCCEHISKNVSVMDKQSECPEECREASSSLMFAAARLPNLPELRELRTLLFDRYGNTLELYINKEFAEKMNSGPPSKELKLQLLQVIAAESGLDWDSKALENKLFDESAYDKTRSDPSPYERTEASRNEDRSLPKKKETSVPPVKDIQVDTIRENEAKPLNYRSVPPPPYNRPQANKPNHDQEAAARPMPKSVRSRSLKPETNEEEKIQHINKEKAAEGQRILKFLDDGGQRDNEEKMMDKLLKHYSRRNGSPSSDGRGKATKQNKTTNRVASLPVRLASYGEASKAHARSSSYQAESLQGSNGHVHPKLPDYEDFVARLAELRGKKAG